MKKQQMKRFGVYGKVAKDGKDVYVAEYRLRFQAIRHGWQLLNSCDWFSATVENMNNGKVEWSAEAIS